jgi:LPXTG-site transpeptidase (sortase) family protein
MLRVLRKLDRFLALGGLVAIASAVLLSAGLLAIFSAVADDHVDLPSEGSLEEMLRGGVDDRGSAGVSPADASADPREPVATPGPEPSPSLIPTSTPPPPPPPAPVALAIPRLEAAAPVVPLGLDADRYPEVPDGPDEVAWYTFTAAPGQSSNAVFAAHVDWIAGMEAIFYRLSELEIDDIIKVTLDDGSELGYGVTGNVAVPYDDPAVLKAMERTIGDVITLITCGGTWESDLEARYGGNYSHRIIVRAERVAEARAGLFAVPDTV